MIFMLLLCVYVTLLGYFFSQKTLKIKWSNWCLFMVRKSLCHILLGRKDWKFLKKVNNRWLCDTLKSLSQSLAHHIFFYYPLSEAVYIISYKCLQLQSITFKVMLVMTHCFTNDNVWITLKIYRRYNMNERKFM